MSAILSCGGRTAHLPDEERETLARCLEGWLREGHKMGQIASICPHGDEGHINDFDGDDYFIPVERFMNEMGFPVALFAVHSQQTKTEEKERD